MINVEQLDKKNKRLFQKICNKINKLSLKIKIIIKKIKLNLLHHKIKKITMNIFIIAKIKI